MNPAPKSADEHFFFLLRDAYWLLRALMDQRLEPLGLSAAQWRPLLLLYGNQGPMTQAQLARALGLESPTVVRLLDRLSAKGWVARRHCPGDRRAYHVQLMPKAEALCHEIEPLLSSMRREALAGMDKAELAVSTHFLQATCERLEGLLAAPAPATAVARKPLGKSRARPARQS